MRALWLALLWFSCSESKMTAPMDAAAPMPEKARAEAPPAGGALGREGGDANAQAPEANIPEPTKKVIIYTAETTIIVEKFDDVEGQLEALSKQFGAYVADSEVQRYDGRRRRGKWVMRVPVAQYRALLNAFSGFGQVESTTSKASDVTAEYVDLEATLSTKRAVEKRLLDVLAKEAGKITEVLEVERELGRTREEIERVEGKMRYFANLAALSTITLTVIEKPGYEAPPSSPSLAERVKFAWRDSIDALVDFCEGSVVFVVALVPWLPVLAVIGVALWGLRRLLKRLRKKN